MEAEVTTEVVEGGASLGTLMKTIHKSLFGPGTTSPEHRIEEKLQVADQATQRKDNSTTSSKMVTRAQKAKIECAQTSGLEGKAGDRNCHLKV